MSSTNAHVDFIVIYDFQMWEGLVKHVPVAQSSDSHPKNGESASNKNTLVVQHRKLSRPSPHFPLYLLHPKSSPFLWHATPSPISDPASNLWSNPLLLNASTNTSPFQPQVCHDAWKTDNKLSLPLSIISLASFSPIPDIRIISSPIHRMLIPANLCLVAFQKWTNPSFTLSNTPLTIPYVYLQSQCQYQSLMCLAPLCSSFPNLVKSLPLGKLSPLP